MNIIIVGAGILGASTAYHLAKKGYNVTIVDSGDSGQATSAAAGMICPWLSQRRNKAWYTLVRNGAAYYPKIIAELEKDGETNAGYKQVGALRLHTDEKKLRETMERAQIKRQDAPEIGELLLLSPRETKERFPLLGDGTYSSLYAEGAARVDGRLLRDAFLRAAEKAGAQFIKGDAALLKDGTNVAGIKVNGKEIYGDTVVLTTGAWAQSLLDPFGIDVHVSEQKAQILHLQLPNTETGEWPIVIPPGKQYIAPFEQGRIVAGSSQEDDTGFDERVTAGPIHEILSKTLQVAPGLADAEWTDTRVGFRPFTPNFLPVFGDLPELKGLLFANGLGATGLTMAPYLGSILARMAVDEPLELNVADYAVQTGRLP
ncbi:NAD(P)/FAD-dependent oxidoreductase [Natribacillus halophilus]|uniref:D-amino acid dehydrogenase small subunit n=1 Tax=Natribacillus halophilus TaxID=549003 RepID=A0A1G8NIK0_9BACI|nr:FAD-binding oxidoreductase [Natribacillus halophilus]SDI79876.1 D-amino acid dehydrogenase small subunit [Natribacillus halophilus]